MILSKRELRLLPSPPPPRPEALSEVGVPGIWYFPRTPQSGTLYATDGHRIHYRTVAKSEVSVPLYIHPDVKAVILVMLGGMTAATHVRLCGSRRIKATPWPKSPMGEATHLAFGGHAFWVFRPRPPKYRAPKLKEFLDENLAKSDKEFFISTAHNGLPLKDRPEVSVLPSGHYVNSKYLKEALALVFGSRDEDATNLRAQVRHSANRLEPLFIRSPWARSEWHAMIMPIRL